LNKNDLKRLVHPTFNRLSGERSKRKGESEYVDCGEESERSKRKGEESGVPRELNQKMWGSGLGRGRENFLTIFATTWWTRRGRSDKRIFHHF